MAGGVLFSSQIIAFAQDRGTHEGLRKLPRGKKPAQHLDLDANGQLRRAPEATREALSDAAEAAERERRALRALLRRRPAQHVPDNPDERDRLLGLLYGHLAKAKDKATAKRIVAAIERVWIHSGNDTVSVLMRRALAAEKKKDFKKALKFLDYIVKIAPDYTEGWNQRAYIYFKQKDYARALGDLRRVLALDPNHYKALEGLGQILREIDKKRAALEVFRRLVEVYPLHKSAKDTEHKLARDILGQKS